MNKTDDDVDSEIADKLCDFFSKMENNRIIVFDTETGGVEESSPVLSISAIMLEVSTYGEIHEVDRFNRFYYASDSKVCHPKAIEVNGLDDDTIGDLRGRANYPLHFEEDNDFYEWCKGVTSYIGHNVSFDLKYVPKLEALNVFDTMFANIDYVKAEWNSYRSQWKWPKLSETCTKYEVTMDEDRLHESIYDVEMTVEIFKRMVTQFPFRMKRLKEFGVV